MNATYTVIAADNTWAEDPGVVVVPGETVVVTPDDDPCTRFAQVVTQAGKVAYIPSTCLNSERPMAKVTRRYDTQSLRTEVGDQVTIINDDVESGWAWCRSESGEEGWVIRAFLSLNPVSSSLSSRQAARTAS